MFPNLKVDVIDENTLKSEQAKEMWRPFLNEYANRINDWNFATLLRKDAKSLAGYCEANTMIVPRIQFLAIEIARNREGPNAILRETLQQNSSKDNSRSQETVLTKSIQNN
jgi:hypothetical protein